LPSLTTRTGSNNTVFDADTLQRNTDGVFNIAFGEGALFITGDGKLGTVNFPSSVRFNEEIYPIDKASEAILAQRPWL
jgi:hypothetical protein